MIICPGPRYVFLGLMACACVSLGYGGCELRRSGPEQIAPKSNGVANPQVSAHKECLLLEQARTEGSRLPMVVARPLNGDPSKEAFDARIHIYRLGQGAAGCSLESEDLGVISLNIRGQTSRGFPKKNYTAEFLVGDQHDGIRFLSLPSSDKVVWYGGFHDYSFQRNHLAYELARRTGEFSVQTDFFELYWHTGGGVVFHGLYLAVQRIDRDSLGLKKFDGMVEPGETFENSLILKLDPPDEDEAFFDTGLLENFVVAYPKAKRLTERHLQGLKASIGEIESLLKGPKDAGSIHSVKDRLSLKSFANGILVQDLAQDVDGLWKSQYLYKDYKKKLHMGPVWDFDLAFDNYIFNQEVRASADGHSQIFNQRGIGHWIQGLREHYGLDEMIRESWHMLRRDAWSTPELTALIMSARDKIRLSAARDLDKWRDKVLRSRAFSAEVLTSQQLFEKETDFLRDLVEQRMRYLDTFYSNQ